MKLLLRMLPLLRDRRSKPREDEKRAVQERLRKIEERIERQRYLAAERRSFGGPP